MVGDFGCISCFFLGIPHDVVQVWKVVIQVDSFKAVSSVSPASQLRALQQISQSETESMSTMDGLMHRIWYNLNI